MFGPSPGAPDPLAEPPLSSVETTSGASLSPVRFIFHHLSQYRGAFVAALVWSVVFVIVPMQVPLLAGMMVSGLLGQPASFYGIVQLTSSTSIFWFAVFGLVAVAAGYGLTAYLSSYSVAELGRTFVRERRKDLIAKLDRSPAEFHARYGPGELLSRVVTDAESTRQFITQVFFNTVRSVVRVVFPVVLLLLLDPFIALVAVAILPVQWLISRRLQARLRDASRVARATKGRLVGAVQENLAGIETIQTSGAEAIAIARVSREADRLAADQIRVRNYFGLISGTTFALTSVGLALAWAVGGWQVLQGTLTVGALVAITGYVAILYLPMQRFTSVANTYQTGMVAFERIREVLETPATLVENSRAPALHPRTGAIELRDVSFGYGATPILSNVSLQIPAGRMTVLLGPNGSGKSSLLKLVARLYDPTSGAVLIDGQDVKGVRLSSLRSQIGFVPQSPAIFSGTIEENIRFGRPEATDAEVEWAARMAGAHAFIERLPGGYRTMVGGTATRLSGGEAQRVAIARALLRRPRILLLDEPNSALDEESEARLFEELARLKGGVTIVLVAHHVEAVRAVADEVVIMTAGRVVEQRAGLPSTPMVKVAARATRAREVAFPG